MGTPSDPENSYFDVGNHNLFLNKNEGVQLQYLINIMCKFGWILMSSLGEVVDKRWVTPSDLTTNNGTSAYIPFV
jgi:hypothetical protein